MKESRLKLIMTAVIDIVFAGLLWLLCSLPIVTAGPASAALYYAVVKCIRHERGRLTGTFFKGFRMNFRQSLPVWLLELALLALGLFDLYAYKSMDLGLRLPLQAFSGILILPVLLTLPWVFAVISRFSNSFGGTLRFVGYLAVHNFGRTLLLCAELLGAAALTWAMPPILLVLPGLLTLLMSFTIEPVFRPYTEEQSAPGEDDWYNE